MPLAAGPMRVVANIIWNLPQGQSADYMKAYLYFYDITDLNDFWGYFMDYAVYGQLYAMAGFSSDFYEINFEPVDIMCYILNGYDPVT